MTYDDKLSVILQITKKDRDYLNINKDLDEFARPHTKEENTLFLFRYWKQYMKYWEPEEDDWD